MTVPALFAAHLLLPMPPPKSRAPPQQRCWARCVHAQDKGDRGPAPCAAVAMSSPPRPSRGGLLHLTSLLFGTVTLHAFHAQHALYHHLSLALLAFSVAAHTARPHPLLGFRVIDALDRLVAHLAFLAAAVDVGASGGPRWRLLLPTTIALLWVAELCCHGHPRAQHWLHVMLHVGSVLGLHALLLTPVI